MVCNLSPLRFSGLPTALHWMNERILKISPTFYYAKETTHETRWWQTDNESFSSLPSHFFVSLLIFEQRSRGLIKVRWGPIWIKRWGLWKRLPRHERVVFSLFVFKKGLGCLHYFWKKLGVLAANFDLMIFFKVFLVTAVKLKWLFLKC